MLLINLSNTDQEIAPHERIAQLVVAPYTIIQCEDVNSLDETRRGQGGFGSTGTE